MHAFLTKGLTETAALWSDVKQGYAWVHHAAHLLSNDEQHTAAQVRQTYETFLAEVEQTPTLPKPPPLGLAPQDCPSSPVLKRINTTASLLGTPPTWVGGFIGPSRPLLLFGENHTMYPWIQYNEHGWEHKFLYVVGPAYTEKVTLHGANLRDGAPLWLSAGYNHATREGSS